MPASSAEYDALYAAVCAAPDDDTPRLALADWLDEHDDPHRAAHMRAEVLLHRLRETDPHASAAFSACASLQMYDRERYYDPAEVSSAVARMTELQKQVTAHAGRAEARWKAVLGKRVAGRFIISERGLPHCISISNAKQYARVAAKLPPENLPDFRLFLHKADDPGFDDVLACKNFARATGFTVFHVASADTVRKLGVQPAVRNFTELSLSFDESDPAILAAVATQPNWRSLRSLSLSHSFSGHSARLDLPSTFAKAAHLRTLTRLDLSIDALSGAGLAHLAKLGLPNLRQLDISNNRVDAVGALALVSGRFPELRTLDASGNRMRNAGAATLIDSHAKLPNLAVLNLQGNRITDPKLLAAHVAGPCFPNLVGLSLRENRTKQLDAKTLAAPGRGPTLRFLSFRHCGLSAKAVESLAAAPSLANLLCIDLAGCEIGDEGARAIASSNWQRLSCLDLDGNGITAEGVKALVAWPGVARLQHLHLGRNPIGLDGAKALAACGALKKCRKLVVPYDDKLLPATGRELLRAKFGRRLDF